MRLNKWRAGSEAIGLFTLIAATAFFVSTSWRKWPDPLIDFGQQLYNAWRLSEGDVLYRDVGCLYGPLSQYFNAGLLRILGPGLIILAVANIVIFVATTTGLYILFRRSWGPPAAWLSILIFISVFGFSQFVDAGNYNYAAPYAHETTHGMLICVLLCFALMRLIRRATAIAAFVAGLLFGATLILKPEFILAAFIMTVLAGCALWSHRSAPNANLIYWGLVGAALPSFLFAIYFAYYMPVTAALSATSRAWLNVFNRSFNSSPLTIRLMGLDHPWSNFVSELIPTALASIIILALASAMLLIEREIGWWLRLSIAFGLVIGLALLGCFAITWIEIGRCLFGLTLIYLLISIWSCLRSANPDSEFEVRILRLLITGLAIALMARMFLNPRIYHYGYYQAAVAALLVPSFMIGEMPAWISGGRRAQALALAGTFALVMPGIVDLANRSERGWALKTEMIGEGRDRFYCFRSRMDPIGDVCNAVIDALRKKGGGETLTVLPEGESINYFARLRNPVPHACFYKGAMETQTEAELVTDLQKESPYWIVIVSRDLIGWGIERYGEKSGSGAEVLRWVEQNYKQVGSIGGDPLDYRQRGAIILRKYSQ